jgi:uncharacterized protein
VVVSRTVAAFLSGLVFGAGLIVSQMSNPGKVIGFLDIAGNWDPSLALVMAGALVVFGAAYRSSRNRRAPLLLPQFATLRLGGVDRPLVAGSLLFGIGWGLSGFCPGPALVSSAFGDWRVWVFVAAMILGMVLYRFRPGRESIPGQA